MDKHRIPSLRGCNLGLLAECRLTCDMVLVWYLGVSERSVLVEKWEFRVGLASRTFFLHPPTHFPNVMFATMVLASSSWKVCSPELMQDISCLHTSKASRHNACSHCDMHLEYNFIDGSAEGCQRAKHEWPHLAQVARQTGTHMRKSPCQQMQTGDTHTHTCNVSS